MTNQPQKDTSAWIAQVWISFAISFGVTMAGVAYLPVDMWTRGFMAMGVLFTVASSFSLAKTVRDNHEAGRLINRISEAKAEKILKEFELHEAA